MALTYIDRSEASRLLRLVAIESITTSRRAEGFQSLSVDGGTAVIFTLLGSGGSKEVYDVRIGDKYYALAVPGIADSAEMIYRKWNLVLSEPENTTQLRSLGLHVNDFCGIVLSNINGYEFPALIMKRYSDHEFSIYDSKNPQGRYHEFIMPEQHVTDNDVLLLFSAFELEIMMLIRNGVRLGRDSFNLCDISGVPHLYFNDLGSVEFKDFSQKEVDDCVAAYVSSSLGAFVNTISERAYRNNAYVNSMAVIDHPLSLKLRERVMRILQDK